MNTNTIDKSPQSRHHGTVHNRTAPVEGTRVKLKILLKLTEGRYVLREAASIDEPRKISWQVLCRHNSSINYLIFLEFRVSAP